MCRWLCWPTTIARSRSSWHAIRSTEICSRYFFGREMSRILISIVKYIEDKRNVEHDTRAIGVPVILVVEDNIRYYSSFLPTIYTELITQSRRLLSEGLNVAHKLVRMRARPKILLASNYEDAARQVMQYREYLLGVVSDVEFPHDGELSPDPDSNWPAWFVKKCRMLPSSCKPAEPNSGRAPMLRDIPSCANAHLRCCAIYGVFLPSSSGSATLRSVCPTAVKSRGLSDLNELEERLHEVPAESIAYHSERNHFSRWLRARTEFALAQKLRPRKVSDFATLEHLRRDLIESIAEYRSEQSQVLIGDFNASTFKSTEGFFLTDWRRLARRKSARTGFHPAPAAQISDRATLRRCAHCRAAEHCVGDGYV